MKIIRLLVVVVMLISLVLPTMNVSAKDTGDTGGGSPVLNLSYVSNDLDPEDSTGVENVLSWDLPDVSFDNIRIFRNTTDKPEDATLLTTLGNSVISYTDDTATPRTTYFYYVQTTRGPEANYTVVGTAKIKVETTHDSDGVFPERPTISNTYINDTASYEDGGVEVVLEWDSNPEVEEYIIYKTEVDGSFVWQYQVPRDQSFYVDTEVVTSMRYNYVLVAVDSDGDKSDNIFNYLRVRLHPNKVEVVVSHDSDRNDFSLISVDILSSDTNDFEGPQLFNGKGGIRVYEALEGERDSFFEGLGFSFPIIKEGNFTIGAHFEDLSDIVSIEAVVSLYSDEILENTSITMQPSLHSSTYYEGRFNLDYLAETDEVFALAYVSAFIATDSLGNTSEIIITEQTPDFNDENADFDGAFFMIALGETFEVFDNQLDGDYSNDVFDMSPSNNIMKLTFNNKIESYFGRGLLVLDRSDFGFDDSDSYLDENYDETDTDTIDQGKDRAGLYTAFLVDLAPTISSDGKSMYFSFDLNNLDLGQDLLDMSPNIRGLFMLPPEYYDTEGNYMDIFYMIPLHLMSDEEYNLKHNLS
ncbi:hypothetical protein EJF36_05625 [Bacillus sp. HMF5848]|uniref:hypothetical protein n=1 Tax=Bacillus sp. HMF5848 TaxID=2495421 RepID=UPI000F768E16|nr:hypothetical protein [Bacillus sp. HMF5848]RSK26378.1 hypothetical protein EJF36_05625 [Bacillus sp. HMF5848]